MGKIYLVFLSISFIFISSAYSAGDPKQENLKFDLSSIDPETASWLARVDSAGGTVSDSIIEAVDDYVKEIKGLKFQSVSIRSLILRENWFCGDLNSAFVPIFRNSGTGSAILGSVQDINRNYPLTGYNETGPESGLKGNGSNRYIETGFTPLLVNELPKNDVHFMVYSMSNFNDAGRLGCRNSNGDALYLYPRYTNGYAYLNINSVTESNFPTLSANGYIMGQRYSSQLLNGYYNDVLVNSIPNNSLNKPNVPITIGAFNNNGVIGNYMSMRLGGYSIGKSLTQVQQLIHYNAVQRLMTRLGRSNIAVQAADFKSKLITFTGNKLIINYQTRPGGYLQFELQDAQGNPIQNFSLNDCPPVSGNEFFREVSWNSGSDLSSLVNTPVFLRIKMFSTDLFSLQFQNQISATDSSKSGFKIGTYKQFFADTLMFTGNIPALRKMHNPVKKPTPVISPEMPWEGNGLILTYSNIGHSKSVITDEMVYKIWIRTSNPVYGRLPVYYESTDGENWTRPNLESYKYNGSMDNNIINDNPVSHGGLYTVVEDSAQSAADSTRRYKSVYNTHTTRADSRLNVSFSRDGLVWVPYSGNPIRHSGEDLTSSGWNPVLGKYLGYFRDSVGIRKVGRYLSTNWTDWTYTGTILIPDAIDIKTTDYYYMNVLFKDSVYWGFLGHFQMNINADENPGSPTRTDNTMFVELLFSRDGINFVRCGNRQAFLNYGELGNWDDQMVLNLGVPVRVGNEFYIYYNGFNYKHMSPITTSDGRPGESHIGLAKIGIDRFVSLTVH